MISIDSHARNLLPRDAHAALIVVKMNPSGQPDNISYWKSTGDFSKKGHEETYVVGALVDIWV